MGKKSRLRHRAGKKSYTRRDVSAKVTRNQMASVESKRMNDYIRQRFSNKRTRNQENPGVSNTSKMDDQSSINNDKQSKYESLGILLDRPKYKQYGTHGSGMASFENWPEGMTQDKRELAEVGFAYTGVDDCVRCFHCSIGLRDWPEGADVWEQHVLTSPKCSHVIQCKERGFIKSILGEERSDSDVDDPDDDVYTVQLAMKSNKDAVTVAREYCRDEDTLKAAVKATIKHELHRKFTAVDLAKAIDEIKEKREQELCLGHQTQPLGTPQLPTYRMDRKPRGFCMILNNETFFVDRSYGNNQGSESKEMPHRNGTERDAASLQHIFEKLGFIVRRHDNLTEIGMMSILTDAAHNVDHTNFDCFVCCILTHGHLGHLYGSNGRLVSIKDLTATFQTNRCPTLAGKPKLFFLQACQGTDKMEGGDIQEDGPGRVPVSGDTVYAAKDGRKEMIPNEADFLLGYATVPGYVSFRSRTLGSWYIRKLCELLDKYATSYDLLSILVEVNNEVAAASASMDGRFYKQIPAPLVTLRKKIFFK